MKNFNEISEIGINNAIGKTVKKKLGVDWISIICIGLFIGSWIFENQLKSLFDNYGWIVLIIFSCNIGVRMERQKWITREEENKYFKGGCESAS